MYLNSRIGSNHPYHTLPIILALVNSNADEVAEKPKTQVECSVRSKVAKKVLEKLKQKNPNLSEISNKTEQLSLALINLAYKKPDTDKKNSISMSDPLMRLKHLENILLPTYALKVHNIGGEWYFDNDQYFVGIARFQSEYAMVGGINAPKKIICVGTDGKSRPKRWRPNTRQ